MLKGAPTATATPSDTDLAALHTREAVIRRHGYPPTISGPLEILRLSTYRVEAEWLAARLAGHGSVIAELCCGVGVSLIAYARHFPFVVGVDCNPDACAASDLNLFAPGCRSRASHYPG